MDEGNIPGHEEAKATGHRKRSGAALHKEQYSRVRGLWPDPGVVPGPWCELPRDWPEVGVLTDSDLSHTEVSGDQPTDREAEGTR